jgi:hypothetical protein
MDAEGSVFLLGDALVWIASFVRGGGTFARDRSCQSR